MRSQASRLRFPGSSLLRSTNSHSTSSSGLLLSSYSSTSRLSSPRRSPADFTHKLEHGGWDTSSQPSTSSSSHAIDVLNSLRDPSNDSNHRAQLSGGPPPPVPAADGSTEKRPKSTRRPRISAEKETEAQLPPRPSFSPELVARILWQTALETTIDASASSPPEPPEADGNSSGHVDLLPETEPSPASASSHPAASPSSPPPYVLEEALSKLLVTLHPHAQGRSLSRGDGSQATVEPTLALYCPIEGGNFVIDGTVQELARLTGADVVVLDAVQLAAGIDGAFGEAATPFEFSPNPLHTSRKSSDPSSTPGTADDENGPATHQLMAAIPMQISIPALALGGGLRPSRNSPLSGGKKSEILKARYFFDALVHAPDPPPPKEGDTFKEHGRPRIVYVRDFDLLADHASEWYPRLVSAVRNFRQGNTTLERVINPITIVLGVSPELQVYRPTVSSPAATPPNSLNLPPSLTQSKTEKVETEAPSNDEEHGAKAREKELKSWLRHWEQYGDAAVRDELPWFNGVSSGTASPPPGPQIISLGGGLGGFRVLNPGLQGGLPEGLSRVIQAIQGGNGLAADGSSDLSQQIGPETGYFTVAGVIPAIRDLEKEAAERMRRRRDINRLAFRMALRKLGGTIPGQLGEYVGAEDSTDVSDDARSPSESMFWVWSRSLVDKEMLDEVAVRVLGHHMAQTRLGRSRSKDDGATASLAVGFQGPTEVSWDAVALAWQSYHQSEQQRKQWITRQRHRTYYHHREAGSSSVAGPSAALESDEVIERVKADPNLDPHEKRLLGCIVDTVAMPTTFASVHLPFKTIDAVRTMVSLPLLYPQAFNQGILKNHSMTGALLLGPPGVGKTLMARAVAKESGARMLMIKPSDVMDMYVGEGEKLVKSVFSLARRLSPCVIFLDEVDALLASRISSRESGSAIAHRSVITEFMQEMDGLKTNKSQGNVVVIGATNRPFDLDDAVLRRLPRRLLIDLPGEKERLAILAIHLQGEILAPHVDLADLAKRTEMYSGSDLKNLVIAAALDAIKESVDLPWETSEQSHATESTASSRAEAPSAGPSPVPSLRILWPRHFEKALTEITPSSSESLGTLHDLRKWNDEFGEGRAKTGGKKSKWGLKFGFGGKDGKDTDGRVMQTQEERTP